jgi:glycosyltransferase involved in cell wall biosynthesis
MRVMHVIGQLVPGGSERMTLQLAKAFNDRGHEHRIAVLSHVDQALIRELRADTVPLDVLHARDDPVRAAQAIVVLRALARRHRIEAIQGHAWRSSIAAGLVGLATRTPAAATLHRVYYPGLQRWIDPSLQTLWRAVIVDSEAVRQLLARRTHIRTPRMVVIPNFVSPEIFDAVSHDARPHGAPTRLLMAAHFTEVKGHRFMLLALAALQEEHAGRFRLDLLGDGPLLDPMKTLSTKLGLSKVVRFHGPRADLARWLCEADVVVLPSLWEGFGLILAEAGAVGKPVVSFSIGGAAEVVVDGETGLLVPPADSVALAAALKRLHEDPELRARLGAAGRNRAKGLYEMNRVLDAYEQLYARMTV